MQVAAGEAKRAFGVIYFQEIRLELFLAIFLSPDMTILSDRGSVIIRGVAIHVSQVTYGLLATLPGEVSKPESHN